MTITLIKRDRYYQLHLPDKPKGQFWVNDIINGSQSRRLLCLEARGGKWLLRASALAYPVNGEQKGLRSVEFNAGELQRIYLLKEREYALLLAEAEAMEDQTFRKYTIQAEQGLEITIGRDKDSGICFDDSRVSGCHAILLYYNGRWSVKDLNSENGIYVNHVAVRTAPLALGDVVYVMGLRIIIGTDFIALNNPGGKIKPNTKLFKRYVAEKNTGTPAEDGEQLLENTEYFYRSPRFRSEVIPIELTVDPPPQENASESEPLLMVLGPALTMGVTSVAMGWMAVQTAMENQNWNNAIPSLVMSGSMLLGMILWPILSRRHTQKKDAKKRRALYEKYEAYLLEVDRQISEAIASQEKTLKESSLSVQECMTRVQRRDGRLWERSAIQDDFLTVRVGTGEGMFLGKMKFPEKHFEAEESKLRDAVAVLRDKPRLLRDIPVLFSLLENHVTAVIGRRNKCLDFANGLLVQLCSLYGYDEVKTVFLFDEAEGDLFDFSKWLPHSWSNERDFRLLATNADEMKALSALLEKEIAERLNAKDRKERQKPHYVIFAFSYALALKAELLRKIYTADKEFGFTVLCFFDTLKNAPKECGTFIELKGREGRIFHQEDRAGGIVTFQNDIAVGSGMREMALQLANIPLDLTASSYQLPSLITFMEMFEAGRVEHLNPFVRWQENDPTKSLQAMVGVGEQGDPFYLDLHEKYHGPHGLVAGMTGSGKSEFIITYILSLALNYHPHEVAFLLIDYKGGGMAKSFEGLPHVAGIITNLDGAAIRRSLISLESDLKRRQAIFNEANGRLGMSNIDIYKYQKEYRAGRVTEPLPHLFIISDEFAELKTQQPEFMAQLISAARIGRSLGVHLILATQKPAGVVDDQIWSNSRFHVCLKVQDKADSMDMLKQPDAAEIKATGRFYLQVGYNELFLMGQSAWAGAPYLPRDDGAREVPCAVSVIDRNGQALQTVRPERKLTAAEQNPQKQLDVITGYISQTAREESIAARKLWLEPIAPVVLLKDLRKQYPEETASEFVLRPFIGECDDPERQRRFPLYLPLTEDGNAIFYGAAGNGKTTLLTTMIYDLLCTHTARTLNLYILDFGAETLRLFAPAPQVGEVMFSGNAEKILNLLKFLRGEIAERKKLFSEYGGDYQSYCKTAPLTKPNIVLIINNYAAFREMFEDWEDVLAYLAMEGTKYGVFIILTAATTNAVRYNIAQNFNQLLVMRLNDETEYPSLLGRTNGVLPARYKGRGLVKLDQVYEFQTAQIAPGAEGAGEEIKALCAALRDIPEEMPAKRIPILPKRVDTEFLSIEPFDWRRAPMGVNRQSLAIECMDLTAAPIMMISSADGDLISPVMQGLAEYLSRYADVMVLDPGEAFLPDELRAYQYYTGNVEAQVWDLLMQMVERHEACKRENHECFSRRVCIVPSLSALFISLSEERQGHLRDLLQNCKAQFHVTLILGDEMNRINSYSGDAWYESQSCAPSLWMGDGAGDNLHSLRLSRIGRELDDLEGEFGLIIRKGKYRIAKLLRTRLETEDDDA